MTNNTPYQVPGWFTRNVFNRLVRRLARMGVSVWGSRILETKGRKTGEPRTTPVNPLTIGHDYYLVAPRGEAQWVRNVRADDGRLALILGRRRREYRAAEVTGAEQVPILRAYLKRWKMEVGVFFGGVGPASTDAELAAIAREHPVFRLTAARR